MELRTLHMEDAQSMMEVIREAFAAEPWNDRWEDEGVFWQYLTDLVGNANSLALGLYAGDVLAGLALGRLKHWFDGVEYCIDDLCVRSGRQGQGIGSAFLTLLQTYAKAQGYKSLSLRTNRNAPAYHFYQRNGFQERQDQVFFEKPLR